MDPERRRDAGRDLEPNRRLQQGQPRLRSHCYAETLVNRFAGSNKGFPNRFDVMTLRGEDHLTLPLRWRKPKRIFVNSVSDLFHADVPDGFIAEVWAVMALAEQHTFQLLTKRPGRMRSLLNSDRFHELVEAAIERRDPDMACGPGILLENVWLGVSVESQQWADVRIPALLDTPAAVRFLSCEPLLGTVDLGAWMTEPAPVVFKQWGERRPLAPDECAQPGDEWSFGDSNVMMRRVGKKLAGRELDGRAWDQFPAVSRG